MCESRCELDESAKAHAPGINPACHASHNAIAWIT
jgi:hypothetical protein